MLPIYRLSHDLPLKIVFELLISFLHFKVNKKYHNQNGHINSYIIIIECYIPSVMRATMTENNIYVFSVLIILEYQVIYVGKQQGPAIVTTLWRHIADIHTKTWINVVRNTLSDIIYRLDTAYVSMEIDALDYTPGLPKVFSNNIGQ
jgi:hypothetical protein